MFTTLDQHLHDEPAFDVFLDIIRDAVLDLRSLDADDVVFDHVLPEPRIHSVGTAAKELGVNPDRLRPLLVEAGAVASDDHRPHARATFDARRFAPLLETIASLVPDGAMHKMLGATETEMMALEHAGILVPRTALSAARLRWRPKEAEALLDELQGYAARSEPSDAEEWMTIQVAQARTGVSIARIFASLRAGDLRLRRQLPHAGYHGFQVGMADVLTMKAASSAKTGRAVSLSEFGRGIGLRDAARLLALVDRGDLAVEDTFHPVTRRRMRTVPESSMAAFRARFLSLTMIEQEFGLQRNASRSLLDRADVRPYLSGNDNGGTLYLRIEVEQALRAAGHGHG